MTHDHDTSADADPGARTGRRTPVVLSDHLTRAQLERGHDRAGAAPSSGAAGIAPGPLGHVLIVDDDSTVRSVIATVLRMAGYLVSEASQAAEALEIAREITPDAVVSNVALPRMSGVALCRHLRAELATQHVPLVLVTASTAEASWDQVARLAPVDVVSKRDGANAVLRILNRRLLERSEPGRPAPGHGPAIEHRLAM